MQAFTADELSHMEGVVHDMRDYHSRFERHEMSADDFYDLFCSKEDAQCIKRATELIGLSQYTSYITVQLEFTINDRTVFAFIRTGSVLALPRNTKNIRDGAPPDLVNRLVDYVAMQSDITARYSRVTQLVQHLNALCASPSQMRFLWPAVSTLASRIAHPKTKEKLLSKLSRNFRSAVSPVSPALREACRDTAETVAAFQLLPNTPPEGKDILRISANLAPRHAVSSLGPYSTI